MEADESKYTRYPITSYTYWEVYLHPSQAYLGRCKVALKRMGELDPFIDVTEDEQAELLTILAWLKKALDKLYQPGLLNYANFRNTWHRCHWHVIPRYETPRTIDGVEFRDANWGRNYAPYDKDFKISEALKAKIQDDIRSALE
jgi:diadenosine tetraphosphate (Ap4A) HIT family hydrolase